MDVSYKSLLNEIDYYLVDKRKESAAFLMWYLEKYFRLDKYEAIDCVCDNNGDKGVDGIYVNEALGTIDIFQSKISQSDRKTVGDTILKEFYGTLSQFKSKDRIEKLLESAGKAEVASLIRRLGILDKIEAYNIRGIFVANIELSDDGNDYILETDDIEFIGKTHLEKQYISDEKDIKRQSKAVFDISSTETTAYYVDDKTETYIAPIKAHELVKLEGIDDQSIFDYNVRGALGNTKINKGIVKSIKDSSLHKMFPLFHNGITIVSDDVSKDENHLTLEGFYVVNGCQSLTSLYNNQKYITDNLRVLTKVIKVPIDSPMCSKITEYSNSQNGVKPRDFKSYNQIQIRLQNEIMTKFKGEYFYEIKRGESSSYQAEVISNEITGILLMSFDLKEPWNTHRKYQVFEDSYNKLFARPDVTAERVVFLHLLNKLVNEKIVDIDNQLIARYALTRYAIIFMLRTILEKDDLGIQLIRNPAEFFRNKVDIPHLNDVLSLVIDDIVVDLNAELNDLSEDFDYKSSLRNESWVKQLTKDVASSYQKQVARNRVPSFAKEWESRYVKS